MKRRRENGFVLLMILVLLAVAAAVLGGLCRQSMRDALAANEEADLLQSRWGSQSCREALLPKAELFLIQAEAMEQRPVASVDLNIVLGDQTFVVRLADEQAKLNLNFIYQNQSRAAALKAARLAADGVGGPLRVDLHPSQAAPVFSSLGQVFTTSGGGDSPANVLGAAADVTCWGNGRLNWLRASPAAITAQCQQSLGVAVVKRLLELRSSPTPPGLGNLADDAEISQIPGGLATVTRLLAEQTTCHSIWVVDHAPGGRVSYDLSIDDQTTEGSIAAGPTKTYHFSW